MRIQATDSMVELACTQAGAHGCEAWSVHAWGSLRARWSETKSWPKAACREAMLVASMATGKPRAGLGCSSAGDGTMSASTWVGVTGAAPWPGTLFGVAQADCAHHSRHQVGRSSQLLGSRVLGAGPKGASQVLVCTKCCMLGDVEWLEGTQSAGQAYRR